ncbi:hypothetical protein SAMN04490207_3877 [Pseudomonas gessardii]|nr:hypothetical protein BLL38_21270 [Pseudomonas gessardii]SDR19683.1 hypothetical protein SAMN04490207_3877 [Pseudomonas gessardii]
MCNFIKLAIVTRFNNKLKRRKTFKSKQNRNMIYAIKLRVVINILTYSKLYDASSQLTTRQDALNRLHLTPFY